MLYFIQRINRGWITINLNILKIIPHNKENDILHLVKILSI